ncbi:MAG: hypothetical protein AAF236_17705 [Verrucomicrobiota bacterium]
MVSILIVVGVLVFAWALRTFRHPIPRKLGLVGFLVGTYLAFYFSTGSHLAGVGGVALWFLLPWVELLTRVRSIRLPREAPFDSQPPPGSARFPQLADLTDEIEELGFEHVADRGREWDGMEHFVRLFYHSDSRTEASIGFQEQEGIAWGYLSLTSRATSGTWYRTTDLPFTSTLRGARHIIARRVTDCPSFYHLNEAHEVSLSSFAIENEDLIESEEADLIEALDMEASSQIDRNIEDGILKAAENEELIRFSLRGLIYLYTRVLRDVVRLS